MASPRHIRGFDLVNGTAEEIQELSQLLGKDVAASSVRVILSEGRRFLIVASSFRISENEGGIFDSPFI